jgi:hypothetical protein
MHAGDDTLFTAIEVDQPNEIELQALSAKLKRYQCSVPILLIQMKS